jgi:hypothetical protein
MTANQWKDNAKNKKMKEDFFMHSSPTVDQRTGGLGAGSKQRTALRCHVFFFICY